MEKISVKPPADSIFNRSVVFSRAWKSTYQRSVNFLSAARVNTTCLAGLTRGRALVRTRAGNETGKKKKRLRETSSPRAELAVRLKERRRRWRPWYCVPINFSRRGRRRLAGGWGENLQRAAEAAEKKEARRGENSGDSASRIASRTWNLNEFARGFTSRHSLQIP